jgi:hypothetical protein
MKESVVVALGVAAGAVLALGGGLAGSRPASAQAGPGQCNDFVKLRDDAQQKAFAVKAATDKHADRKDVCVLITRFSAAEANALKFLVANKTWCGVPDVAIAGAKANHEKTEKFRTIACSDAPEAHPRTPTLSDAIATPSIDTDKNTKTGHGTFDSLTGNPLAK